MEINLLNNQHHFSKMDSDWSDEFQQMIMPNPSLFYRDNYIPIQQIPRIDNSDPNLFKSPFHCPILDPASPQPTNLTSSFESIDCLLSGSYQTDTASVEDDGISLIFSNCKTSLLNNNNKNNMEIAENRCGKRKRADQKKPEKKPTSINFKRAGSDEPDAEAIGHMKEIVYQAAAFRPVDFGAEETERRPKRKNVRISSDPQTVAARERRERISERIRVLQRLVPGGSKMDTASMLDEAASYLRFLRSQVKALEALGGQRIDPAVGIGAFGYSPYSSYPFGGGQMQGPNPVRKPDSC